ncbi:MAG: hypothetical protein JWO08_1357 [Verrucomicrobiaceae bacterium]|nr:hypothetical protein [Verrucomicrobiaceae bacterium]
MKAILSLAAITAVFALASCSHTKKEDCSSSSCCTAPGTKTPAKAHKH